MRERHPKLAARSCEDCRQHLYDEKTGDVKRDVMNLPLVRPSHIKTPCSTCAKVPKSVRADLPPPAVNSSHAVELTPQNVQAVEYYLECKAVNSFPADPIVRRHARILRELEECRNRVESSERFDRLAILLGVKKGVAHG